MEELKYFEGPFLMKKVVPGKRNCAAKTIKSLLLLLLAAINTKVNITFS